MPKTVLLTIPGYRGGKNNSLFGVREEQTFQTTRDLDVFSKKKTLRPHTLKLSSVALPTTSGHSDVKIYNTLSASNGSIFMVGEATISAATNLVLWSTSSLSGSPTYSLREAVPTGSPKRVLEEYKDGVIYSYGTTLRRWGDLSGIASATTITSSLTTGCNFLLNHRGLGLLFFVHNNRRTIGKYDGSTVTLDALSLDVDEEIIGIKELGSYVQIGIRNTALAKNARLVYWDGSGILFDDEIDLGDKNLMLFDVVGKTTYAVMMASTAASGSYLRLFKIPLGSSPQLVHEELFTTTAGTYTEVPPSASFGDIFLFTLYRGTFSIDNLIYAFGQGNVNYPEMLAPWRMVSTGAVSGLGITSVKANGNQLIITWDDGTNYYIEATGITSTTTANGRYETDVYRFDPYFKGKIKRIKIFHKLLPASTGFTVYVKHYGNYLAGTTVPSEDSFTSVKAQTTQNSAFTVIEDDSVNFDLADAFQLRINYDTISGINAPEIDFPIEVEAEISDTQ